jgi:hypothetical protein
MQPPFFFSFFSLKDGQQQPVTSVRVCLGDLNGVLELKATLIIFAVHDSDHARIQVDEQLHLKLICSVLLAYIRFYVFARFAEVGRGEVYLYWQEGTQAGR